MLKKLLPMALAVLVLNFACGASALASGQQDKEAKRSARVKKEITSPSPMNGRTWRRR
jgi:hypothetical protein